MSQNNEKKIKKEIMKKKPKQTRFGLLVICSDIVMKEI